MPKLKINGKQIEVPKGTSVIRAAALAGVHIPHFCYHPALSSPANCRMCLVEIERARKLEPACYTKVTDGMVVKTESDKVIAARQAVMEFVLVNHPVDCPICDQAGECKLQDYYMAYDAKPSRLNTPKSGHAKVYPIGPHVIYDGERCILCTRCVRFCDEITGTSELAVIERGDRSEIRAFPGKELDNAYSMNVTDICPVGALTTRDFRFKARVWMLSSTESVCTGCARGCNIHLEHTRGEVQRYRPRYNPEVNEYWMCDAGRLSYKRLHSKRFTALRYEDRDEISWPRTARQLDRRIKALGASPDQVAFAASAQASVEDLVAARHYAEKVLGAGRIYWSGRPDGDGDAMLIHRDKNPNRAGIAHVFGPGVLAQDAEQLLNALEAGELKVLFMAGSELPFVGEALDRFAKAAKKLDLFVVAATREGDLTKAAHVALPLATHAECDGTFINAAGDAQPFYQAFNPTGQALAGWEAFARLSRVSDAPLPAADFASLHAEAFADHAAE